jgi:hypothetical protein
MAFLQGAFEAPLAFAQTQTNYRILSEIDGLETAWRLLTLQPFFSIFEPSSPCFWKTLAPNMPACCNLNLANPIFAAGAWVLLLCGWKKQWLTIEEVLLTIGLLAIPYVTLGYQNCMVSMGRFTLVAFPVFVIAGRGLAKLPQPLAATWLLISSGYLAVYAALFVAGYPLF